MNIYGGDLVDILSYVNSNAIRNHLKDIGYSFNSLEAAWLIYNSNRLSYNAKKKAWLELINEMSDCEIPKRMNCLGWDSLHKFLKEYIQIMDVEIEEFQKDDPDGNYVYRYSYLYKDDSCWTEEYDTIYPTLQICLKNLKEDIADLDETYRPDGTGVIRYRIRKQSLNDKNYELGIEFNAEDEVVEVLHNSSRSDKAGEIIDESFDGLWFDFPTPFTKGDIVWVPSDSHNIRWDYDGGFVLLGLSTWDPIELIKNSDDNTDMNGYGYFVNTNGTVYHEVMCNYMNLEFYEGPYKLNEKILPALSKFVKGDVEVDFLLCAYRKTLLDVASDDIMLKSWFPKELISAVGLDE